MKKFLNLSFAILFFIILLFFTIATLSVFAKWPMYLSGYSSSFETQFNSRFILLSFITLLISFFFFKKSKYGRFLWKVNGILSAVFFIGQLIFLGVMLSTAKKYEAEVSLIPTLKSYENKIKPTETYHYLTIYNEKQLFDVYYPKQKTGKPTIPVILVHGGAFIEGKRDQLGYAAQWFTDHGYTAFGISYPLAKEDRQTYESAANSIATCMSYITRNHQKLNVDASKIILVGGSAGAALVMQTDLGIREGYVKSYEATQPKPPIAVIAIYPPVSLSELFQKMEEGKTVDLYDPMKKYLGGTPQEFPQRFKQVNLIDHLSKGISPTLIVTGDIDHVVNVEAIRNFVNKANALKLPVSYVEIPYGEHVFDANPFSIAGQIEWFKIEEFLKKNRLSN